MARFIYLALGEGGGCRSRDGVGWGVGVRPFWEGVRNIIEIPNQSGVLIHPINSGPG